MLFLIAHLGVLEYVETSNIKKPLLKSCIMKRNHSHIIFTTALYYIADHCQCQHNNITT
jgi:hypothetical protein